VLIVEDEARLARNIAQVLAEEVSYAVDTSTDGEDGLHMARTSPYDLIILDLMLPKMGGLEVLRRLRTDGRRTPVLILTARDSTDDVKRGLDLGGDDYLTKPFDMRELVARSKALIRRAYDRPDPVLAVGELRINTATRAVTFKGKAALLTATEYRMLEYLAMRSGEIVSKADLVDHLGDLCASYGIGFNIHVGETALGIKGRIGFEAGSAVLLIAAHRELEKLVLTKWQTFWKAQLGRFYGDRLHEGHYFDPALRDIEALLTSSQQRVTGETRVRLSPGRYQVTGTRSPFSMMDPAVATYGEDNRLWTGEEAKAFSRVAAIPSLLAMRAGAAR
jgi:DNA-binding response OmpR family regulator